MRKEDFTKLGIADELAEKAAAASVEELKGYIPKSRFDDVNEAKKKLETDLKERDTQLETLKNSTGDIEALKQQIAQLQADNQAATVAYNQLKIDTAVDAAITASQGKNTKAIKALLNGLDKAELADDGTIKGLAEQIEALKKSDAYLFETPAKSGKLKGAVPGAGGNEPGDKAVDTSKMTYTELAAYMAAHPDFKLN